MGIFNDSIHGSDHNLHDCVWPYFRIQRLALYLLLAAPEHYSNRFDSKLVLRGYYNHFILNMHWLDAGIKLSLEFTVPFSSLLHLRRNHIRIFNNKHIFDDPSQGVEF
jgi:hypothetical protein